MAALFHVIAGAALIAAIGAWVVAVRGGRSALVAERMSGRPVGAGSYVLLAFWPFAVGRTGAAEDADRVRSGKAAIAFFISLTVAIAAFSAYTNLTFKRDHAVPAGSTPSAPASAPSKS
ncbi:hypothetical protein [Xanthobacter tagetidis]|uniref:Uncharacterized protein n=1 Tax=Xanthobacter tagetidis TaxID=60216 RepID=A0A3L6ZUI5_9HYPH|nr:hypothetical protein [Xanthobacter tagetidis]MBB6309855.1 hypothetical protein [Xanthobacter tagetidis]RLP71567.1 hypothetical protein D9R14_22305 [Xanthobacter tagetidis]